MGSEQSMQRRARAASVPSTDSPAVLVPNRRRSDGGALPGPPLPIGDTAGSVATPFTARLVTHREFETVSLPIEEATHHTLRFVFELVTSTADTSTRPPFELCLVLDNSGSMAGAKLENLKQAVEVMVGLLKEGDVLHVVSYNSTADVLVQNASTSSAATTLATIRSLQATGGTNIEAALDLALSLLEASADSRGTGGTSMLRRIFLYTDGQPGSGKVSQEELSEYCQMLFEERRMHVSTFGIGTDVNGPLLEAMAEAGGGAYHFMTQRRVEELSIKALDDLSRAIATRGSVEVILAVDGAQTVFPERSTERTHVFPLGDIHEGNKRRLPYSMDIPAEAIPGLMATAQREGSGWSVKVARLVFSCQPVNNPLHLHLQEEDVRVFVPDPTVPTLSIQNSVVAVSFALSDMSERNERAVTLIQLGTTESVRTAIQLLTEGLNGLAAVESHDDEGFVETAIRRVQRTLQRLQLRGLRDASRVALELQMQSNTFERNSGLGFMPSEDGNHSYVASPPRSPVGRFAHSPYPFQANISVAPSSDGMQTPPLSPRGRDIFATSPPLTPTGRAMRQTWHSPGAPVVLNPVDVSKALLDAVALKEREGDSAGPYIPPEFFCSITQALMDDPVMTSDANTYQRSAIEKWIGEGNITSPLTGLGMCDLDLRPNLALRSMIANWGAPRVPSRNADDGVRPLIPTLSSVDAPSS